MATKLEGGRARHKKIKKICNIPMWVGSAVASPLDNRVKWNTLLQVRGHGGIPYRKVGVIKSPWKIRGQ